VIIRVIPWPPRARNPPPKNLRALRGFVLNPRARAIPFANLAPLRETPDARRFRPPTSRASITITSTASLSTSTTLFPFRDHPFHSVAAPARHSPRKKLSRPSRLRVKPPRAIHFANLAPLRETPDARLFRPPTSRASITITSTAALSTSTTLFPFRDHPCHSVATPRASSPQKNFAPFAASC
jgi:hypothetical protein